MADVVGRLNAALSGRYAIERELGRGGMATVYLARDARHDRKVAVKVLHPELAAVLGAGRFLNEIRVTANLQHPHILPLHDSGEAEGFVYYVMPFVDGESLRDRLDREKQLPIQDVIHLTEEIADGLGHAHSLGVIHRDIKPENILLSGGHALIADFGIARAVSDVAGTRLTETGLSVGTPQYMSPEQASGDREIDARSDVYALGCVVYEMLVGEPPHTGPTAQAIVAKVLTQAVPRVRETRETVSAAMDGAIGKALAKLPADRFPTTMLFAEALKRSESAELAVTAPTPPARKRWRALAVAVAAVVVIAGLLLWPPWGGGRVPSSGGQIARLSLTIQPLAVTVEPHSPAVAISPDGSRVAYVSDEAGPGQIYLRRLNAADGTPLAGADRALGPFFSPDGEWLGFVQDDTLKKMHLETRAVTVICPASLMHGADWAEDGTILLGAARNTDWSLARVPADGGPPEILVRPDTASGERYLTYPALLPGERAVLFTAVTATGLSDGVHVLSLETGERRRLVEEGSAARYVSTGHLIYARDGVMMAAPFDPNRQRVTGAAVEVLSDLLMGLPQEDALANYAVSDDGTLVYLARGDFVGERLVWVARDGTAEVIPDLADQAAQAGIAFIVGPRASPDGTTISFWAPGGGDEGSDENAATLWLWDMERGRLTRPVPDASDLYWTIWGWSGDRVFSSAFGRSMAGAAIMETVLGRPERLGRVAQAPQAEQFMMPYSVTADGRYLGYHVGDRTARDLDVWLLSSADGTQRPIVDGPGLQHHPAISPDGRVLAYASNVTGRSEVYLADLAGTAEPRQISDDGGWAPLWSRDGGHLVFLRPVGNAVAVMEVGWVAEPGREIAEVRELFRGPYRNAMTWGSQYDLSSDGRRFLMIRQPQGGAALSQLTVVLNWFAELRTIMGEQ